MQTHTPNPDTLCPLCRRPLAGAPTTTVVDVEPYRQHREPPVSLPVHRACADLALQPADGAPAGAHGWAIAPGGDQ